MDAAVRTDWLAMNGSIASKTVRGSAVLLLVVSILYTAIGLYVNNNALLVGSGTALTHALLLLGLAEIERNIIPIYLRMISMVTCSALLFVISLRMIETGYGFADGDALLEDFSYAVSYTSIAIAVSSAGVAVAVDLIAALNGNRFVTAVRAKNVRFEHPSREIVNVEGVERGDGASFANLQK